MSYSSQEIKSGALVTVSLILLIGLTFMVGNFSKGPTSEYHIRFGYISGLKKDAPVFFAGNEVGRVNKIEVQPDQEKQVLVSVLVPVETVIREDSDAFIDTLGLMGEKFVEITPGTLDSPALKTEAILQGTDPVPMYLLIQKANKLADRMDELTTSLNPLTERINGLVKGHEEDIAKIIINMEQTSANLRDMTHDLKFRPWRLLRKG
ncbi:MAG: MCE family protein [Candidatus Omnitrophica bacterium]|nr:MCE family protein [Candidatus Omnitrophota bacterium]